MEFGITEMWVVAVLFLIVMVILRRDSAKVAETQNITRIDSGEDKNRREYVASGITDSTFPGSKILIIMYSLFCRKCNSTNIYAELGDDKDHIQVFCRDCGYNTLIPLKKLLIREDILPPGTPEMDEKLVRDYLKNLNRNHEADVIDPDESTQKPTNEEISHKHE